MGGVTAGDRVRPTLLITNDDGIDAPGLRFLVDLLVAAGRYRVLVSAPDKKGGQSNVNDLKLAAEVCLPIINSLLNELSTNTYPEGTFLNVDVPTDVLNHKGFKITKQSKHMIRICWEQTESIMPAVDTYQTANIDIDSASNATKGSQTPQDNELLFKRVVVKRHNVEENKTEDLDYRAVQEGYISITPLGALSHTELEAAPYFRSWLQRLADHSSPSSL